MNACALLLLAAIDLVADGKPVLRVASDEHPQSAEAARTLERAVVLISGAALPTEGAGAALRFERNETPGYVIRRDGEGAVIAGRDVLHAVYDLLEGWGCDLDGDEPRWAERANLTLPELEWRPKRRLFTAGTLPAARRHDGVTFGLRDYEAARADVCSAKERFGWQIRVESRTFDDFLPPTLFDEHPEWFALRGGERAARGNFSLLNTDARRHYLDAMTAWLAEHPEVDVLGLFPRVTTVWCERCLETGAPESYALLWREAAARHPDRRFEILATGLTLKPARGQVPKNVAVRFRPGRDGSALQGIFAAGQDPKLAAIAKAWVARGADVVLEIDPAPDSWCGLPWPCHDAVLDNAKHFTAAVLLKDAPALARMWRRGAAGPEQDGPWRTLRARAKDISSWGHPSDAAKLFVDETFPLGFRIGAVERLLGVATHEATPLAERRSAAKDAFLSYRMLIEEMDEDRSKVYARYRGRDVRAMAEKLLPNGAVRRVGPANVRERVDDLVVSTDVLQFTIDRRTATVTGLARKIGTEWSEDLGGGGGTFFTVVALQERGVRTAGRVRLASPETGILRIELSGKVRDGGPGWLSALTLRSGSGHVDHETQIDSPGLAAGCSWTEGPFDRWVCPPYATEGRLVNEGPAKGFGMPAQTQLYVRAGEHGPGLALRVPDGGRVAVMSGVEKSLVITSPGRSLRLRWIVFAGTGELGK
ncbi:MAG: hypothetical protein V3T86_08430 [Planctomycetota bacterium]